MDDSRLQGILAAFQMGCIGDMLLAKIGGSWGPLWTIPPCNTRALERAARQFRRVGVQEIQHARRARLKQRNGQQILIVIVTTLPTRDQAIWTLSDLKPMVCASYLEDEYAVVFREAFMN